MTVRVDRNIEMIVTLSPIAVQQIVADWIEAQYQQTVSPHDVLLNVSYDERYRNDPAYEARLEFKNATVTMHTKTTSNN